MTQALIQIDENDSELHMEFVKKIEKIKKQKALRVDNFAERYALKA